MREALIYQKLADKNVKCGVCNHCCKIADGKMGICGVRENRRGKLFSINYGKSIAVGIDPIEKKPLYYFMPGTKTYSFAAAGCNFRCDWCQNAEISQGTKSGEIYLGREISPQIHLINAIKHRCPSISYTYSEPTMFIEYALDTMKLAKDRGLKNIWVSNGYMSEKSLSKILPYLDAINVDLKSFSEKTHQKYCGAQLNPVLDNLVEIKSKKIHLEVTTLIIPGVNDTKEELTNIASFIATKLSKNIPWHLSRFYPAWKMDTGEITPISTLGMAADIGKKLGIRNIHIGNV